MKTSAVSILTGEMDSPFTVFVLSVAVLWISAQTGTYLRRSRCHAEIPGREDLVILLTATLTLLALIIGFTFSMAVAEYDLRKSSEQMEATIRLQTALWSALQEAGMMGAIAICGNILLGYLAQCNRTKAKLFLFLPLMVSIAFFLAADLDNPRHGVISASPQNLINLSQLM
jgi:hypothetical protein